MPVDLDIIEDIGANFTAKVYAFTSSTVDDGVLNIEFAASVDNAMVSGLEVISI